MVVPSGGVVTYRRSVSVAAAAGRAARARAARRRSAARRAHAPRARAAPPPAPAPARVRAPRSSSTPIASEVKHLHVITELNLQVSLLYW